VRGPAASLDGDLVRVVVAAAALSMLGFEGLLRDLSPAAIKGREGSSGPTVGGSAARWQRGRLDHG
jgi:hypothetical protein